MIAMYGGDDRHGGWRKLPRERFGYMKGAPGELEAARAEADDLFWTIVVRIGMPEAKEIFGALAKPLSKEQQRAVQNSLLLDLYNSFAHTAQRHHAAWSVQKMADWIAKANSLLPMEARIGPRGSTSPATVDKHLRRLLAKRRKVIR